MAGARSVPRAHGEHAVRPDRTVAAVESRRHRPERRRHIQNLIVVGKIVGRDDIDARIPLQFPVRRAQGGAGLEKRRKIDIALPVGFGCLFQFTAGADAGKAEIGGMCHENSLFCVKMDRAGMARHGHERSRCREGTARAFVPLRKALKRTTTCVAASGCQPDPMRGRKESVSMSWRGRPPEGNEIIVQPPPTHPGRLMNGHKTTAGLLARGPGVARLPRSATVSCFQWLG